jgi:ornithine cyclodeaminase/alanine dehydrogenase-like protein (mu-crystallin family)
MSNEKIRVGIIGAGGWAKYGHIPALQYLEDFEIIAVSSRKKETAEEYAAKFNILHALGEPQALITQPGQAQTVSLTLGMRASADVRRAWVAEAGRFEVRLGASSADISQRARVTLSTEWVEPVSREPTRSTIRA